MAIPMPKQQDTRRLDRQGVSRSEIARRPDVDRATVAKYADMDDMTPKPPTDRRRGSKIDPYAALVDGWLEADRMLPRKQRHTARRVHDRLRAETGYDGEYTTTLRYVRRWREANRSGSDGYGELVWAPGVAQIDFGVAQIDFGVAKARIAGELVDDHCLVVTFPHSNMRYVTSLPGENAECLCHGLIEVFEHIGGVPPVIVMDNATGAGRRNARGEVTPAAVFDAFDIKRSLPRKGDPYDNAVVESTNRPLKKELVYRNHYTTIEQLRHGLNDYVWWSDNQRLHSTLGYRSPKEFTEQGLVL
ncbi:IS21 family transposase [Bifidobacterium sp.]|uniref:IS21 family transposase n=1 Tax=Bifidobacterium sp. TaxID=41200 RepID=UPI00284F70D8|nr:IS21 family transposase [Bifidobacterium sp.]MDR4021205.1 IS21 family transposase [Bifidobacterium sp.]